MLIPDWMQAWPVWLQAIAEPLFIASLVFIVLLAIGATGDFLDGQREQDTNYRNGCAGCATALAFVIIVYSGLLLALGSIGVSSQFGDGRWPPPTLDAVGDIETGAVLLTIAGILLSIYLLRWRRSRK